MSFAAIEEFFGSVEIHPAAATLERDGYHLQSLVAGEQAGTHWCGVKVPLPPITATGPG